MRTYLLSVVYAFAFLLAMPLSAQQSNDFHPHFSGYGVVKYIYNINGNTADEGFSTRMLRFIIEGDVFSHQFDYRVQFDAIGVPSRNVNPRLLEAWLQWKPQPWFKLRIGQQKRLMGIEAFTHPIMLGSVDYAQITKKLFGLGDRIGEPPSSGYDVGMTIYGDINLNSKSTLSYRLGMLTGQGCNHLEVNRDKDWQGGIEYKYDGRYTFGIYGWDGSYEAENQLVHRHRYSFAFKYVTEWLIRAEWAHGTGGVWGKPDAPKKSSGYYITVGRNLTPWYALFARYDNYRDGDTRNTENSTIAITNNFQPHKNVQWQIEYNQIRTYGRSPISQIWSELIIRF